MKLKQIFFMFLLAGSAAMAQTIAVNTNDTATGTRVIMTKNHVGAAISVDDSVAKSGLLFFSAGYQSSMVKGKQVTTYFIDLDMFHNDNKLGCINQSTDNVTLTLADGSEIECFQMSDTDCTPDAFKAAFALTSKKGTTGNMEENFKKLLSQNIVRIKVRATEKLIDYKIKPKSSDYMKAHFALIDKTLNGAAK